jgi:hypothetical protein
MDAGFHRNLECHGGRIDELSREKREKHIATPVACQKQGRVRYIKAGASTSGAALTLWPVKSQRACPQYLWINLWMACRARAARS